jgi:hypothetical protein
MDTCLFVGAPDQIPGSRAKRAPGRGVINTELESQFLFLIDPHSQYSYSNFPSQG